MTLPFGVPVANIAINIGAPVPMAFRVRNPDTGAYTAFDSTVRCTFTFPDATTLVKTVGSGIVLSDYLGTTNAVMTITLTEAESRSFPLGGRTTYNIERGTAGSRSGVIRGTVAGEGGENADV